MTTKATPKLRHRQLSVLNFMLAVIIAAVSITGIAGFIGRHTESDLAEKAEEVLAVHAESLTGMLDKYRLLPTLLSRRPDVVAVFANSNTSTIASRQIATETAALSGAMEVAFLRTDGSYLIRGLGVIEDRISPVSQPFIAALQGRLGRQVKVLEDGTRAYVFTAGVRADGKIIGVIATYVGLEELEANWTLNTDPIVAIDETGRVIMSNVPEWRLKNIGEVTVSNSGRTQFVKNGQPQNYLESRQDLTLLNWKLCVLSDRAPIASARAFWELFVGMVCLLLWVLAQAAINRNTVMVRRKRKDRATALKLERIVRDRTRELMQSNDRLAREVEERRATEMQLRLTQDELVQSGKLAALGQMSTSLAHELNQPLSAIKSYADNALAFMDRNRADEARNNLSRISQLADRMAGISRHLKNFARKPNTHPVAVDVPDVVNDALAVIDSRIRETEARISVDQPGSPLVAIAGPVRLQQVLVNLILNAIDAACAAGRQPAIEIGLKADDGHVFVCVADNGRGIVAENLEKVFDPFFTTKDVGGGLGLGLSISYNIVKDFGGHLSAANRQNAEGAIFTIELPVRQKLKEAAE